MGEGERREMEGKGEVIQREKAESQTKTESTR